MHHGAINITEPTANTLATRTGTANSAVHAILVGHRKIDIQQEIFRDLHVMDI